MDRRAAGARNVLDEQAAIQLCDLALSKVDPELAEIFVLFELEELSSPEIAALLEIPLGTVASRLAARARAVPRGGQPHRARDAPGGERVTSDPKRLTVVGATDLERTPAAGGAARAALARADRAHGGRAGDLRRRGAHGGVGAGRGGAVVAAKTTLAAWLPAGVIAAAVAAGVVGVRVVGAARARRPSARPGRPRAVIAPPQEEAPRGRGADARGGETGGGRRRGSAPAPALVASAAVDDLRDQIALIDAARTAVKGGSTERALVLLRRYEASYPGGAFRPEALALRIEALGEGGRAAEARRSRASSSPAIRRARWPIGSRARRDATLGDRAPEAAGAASALGDDDLLRVLLDDAVAEHVGEHQHVLVAGVVGLDVGGPVLLDARDTTWAWRSRGACTACRSAPASSSSGWRRSGTPRCRRRCSRHFFWPASTALRVARLRGLDDVGGDQDVIAQQRRQLLARLFAVDRLDGGADVVLVAQQALRDRRKIGQPRDAR